jgi:5-formyltetrahydrofolate cyclo-ligase
MDKQQWRTRLKAHRSEVSDAVHAAEAVPLAEAAVVHLGERGATVGGYVPVGSEPGSLEMFDRLRERGCRILLPIVVGAGPLDWAEYEGPESLRQARYGLREPAGDRLGPDAVAEASVLFIPALAVDRQGTRLGRGAGHYDRSLPLASPQAERIGVVRDAEFVDELPGEPHDVRMTAVLTPERGVVALPV